MRFLHLSDLHLGKRVCEFSMLEEQRYILEEILTLLDETPVDGVLLAGDLYDKPVPPAEAVRLLDWFLTQLAARKLPVFAISGNHDSADRVAFGSALLADSRVYVSPVFTGAPQPIPLQDAHGTVDVYLLPFLKPAMVRHVWPDEPIESYNDALACVLRHCTPDPGHRSVLVAHSDAAALGDLAGHLGDGLRADALSLVLALGGAAGDGAVGQGQGDGNVAAEALGSAGEVTGHTRVRTGRGRLCTAAVAKQADRDDRCHSQCRHALFDLSFLHDFPSLLASWFVVANIYQHKKGAALLQAAPSAELGKRI